MTDNELDRVGRFLYELAQLNIQLKKGDFYKEQYLIFLDNWQNEELDNIFNTAGKNINNPFRPKKDNPNWFKFRKFPAPQKNMQGIYTGETYHALFRGFKVGDKIDIFKRISRNKLQYGYKANYKSKDITKYINVNLGVSEDFLNKEADRIAEILIEIIDNIREKYSV